MPRPSPAEVAALETLVLADSVSKSYPLPGKRRSRIRVLDQVSVTVNRGEVVAVVGPSGSGKSTLLHCLAGLEPTSQGSIRLMDADLGECSRQEVAEIRSEYVGFVFQSLNLIPSLTVAENIVLPARIARKKLDDSRLETVLDHLGLSNFRKHRSPELSGGQQQRVAVGRVLYSMPELVFADEPTGALDTKTGRMVLDELCTLRCDDKALVLVTHDAEAAARADRVYVLRDGAVCAEIHNPTPAEILMSIRQAGESAQNPVAGSDGAECA